MTDNHDRGLQFDLATLFGRRRALSLLGGAGLTLVACAPSTTTSSSTTTTGNSSAALMGSHVLFRFRAP